MTVATETSRRKTQILVIPSWYPSQESPLNGVFVREQARALAKQFDVTVLTPRFPSWKDLLRLRFGPKFIKEREVTGLRHWQIRQLKLPTLRGRWVPWWNQPDHVLVYYRKFAATVRRGFAWYVRERGLPDVIHAHVVLPAG